MLKKMNSPKVNFSKVEKMVFLELEIFIAMEF